MSNLTNDLMSRLRADLSLTEAYEAMREAAHAIDSLGTLLQMAETADRTKHDLPASWGQRAREILSALRESQP